MSDYRLPVKIPGYDYPLITACMVRTHDNGMNLRKTLKYSYNGLCSVPFRTMLDNFTRIFHCSHAYTIEKVESFFNVNICILQKYKVDKSNTNNPVIKIVRLPTSFVNLLILIDKQSVNGIYRDIIYTRYTISVIQLALNKKHKSGRQTFISN